MSRIDLGAVGYEVKPVVARWSPRDTMLYALSVGCGTKDRQFCTENSRGLPQRVLPTFAAVVLDVATECLAKLGEFPVANVLHGMERLRFERELPPEGVAEIRGGVSDVFDKGTGALIWIWTSASDVKDGRPLFRREMGVFVRGAGGWRGERGPSSAEEYPPDRKADTVVEYQTTLDQALLYRLTGDRNPLHSDPVIAAESGFDRPILQGMCTLGFTARGLLRTLCQDEPSRFLSIEARFTAPVWPGDSLAISVWNTAPGIAHFRTTSGDRIVIDQGVCEFRAPS